MKKIILWIIAVILAPIVAGLYFIWPSKLFNEKMSKGWKVFWWVLYSVLASIVVTIKIAVCICIITDGQSSKEPTITQCIDPAPYRTSDCFYKLTGVEFPELNIVDSLTFNDNTICGNLWNEYKFVAKDSLKTDFYKRLERACVNDSTHWSSSESGIYEYWIYPAQVPVDRSSGMCDRKVVLKDGIVVDEWQGGFISVEIQKDTIVLREGWLR